MQSLKSKLFHLTGQYVKTIPTAAGFGGGLCLLGSGYHYATVPYNHPLTEVAKDTLKGAAIGATWPFSIPFFGWVNYALIQEIREHERQQEITMKRMAPFNGDLRTDREKNPPAHT